MHLRENGSDKEEANSGVDEREKHEFWFVRLYFFLTNSDPILGLADRASNLVGMEDPIF